MREERVMSGEPAVPETDDELRKVYGDSVAITRVGRFTLIHLDAPSPETISKRALEFDPADFFFDDCPLCAMAKESGGHIIFDADDVASSASRSGDPSDALREPYSLSGDADEKLTPAAAFDLALVELLGAAEGFGEKLDGEVPQDVAERYFEDVEGLHGRLVEVLWAQESTRRVEEFEVLVERALAAVRAVCECRPALEPASHPVRQAIEATAATWRVL
jgi:hypothetical protein